MAKEERLERRSHKLLLVVLKFIPMVTALCYALNVLFAYMDIELPALSHISGMSLLTWLFIWIATNENSEDAAYLTGYITMRMYEVFRSML